MADGGAGTALHRTAQLARAVEWTQPWFEPHRLAGERIARALDDGACVADALNQTATPAARFVPAGQLAKGEAYEAFIRATGDVPTRDNLHDLFNGLVWIAFPRTKQRLNELQAAEIARLGVGRTRGPLRDAMTVFDESGALLQAPDALWSALAARDWHRLFIDLRPLWREARLVLFGHALLEKLVRPRKPVTAHVLRVPRTAAIGSIQSIEAIDSLDAAVARRLDGHAFAQKPFVPLPVLGVPGWWAENEGASFYDDAGVFRSPRSPAEANRRTAA